MEINQHQVSESVVEKTKISAPLNCDSCLKPTAFEENWWCARCSESICSFCAMTNHQNHGCSNWQDGKIIKECLQRFRPYLKLMTPNIDEHIRDYCDKLAIELKNRSSIFQEVANFVNNVEDVFGYKLDADSSAADQEKSECNMQKKLHLVNSILSSVNGNFTFDANRLIHLNQRFDFPAINFVADLFFKNSMNDNILTTSASLPISTESVKSELQPENLSHQPDEDKGQSEHSLVTTSVPIPQCPTTQMSLNNMQVEQSFDIPAESLTDSINTTIETPVIVSEYPTIEIGPYEELQLKKAIEMSIAQNELSFQGAIQEATKLSLLEEQQTNGSSTKHIQIIDLAKQHPCEEIQKEALWKYSKTLPLDTPLLGFSNLGNTCYMNAILQALFGLEVFTKDLLKSHAIFKERLCDKLLLSCLPQLLKYRNSPNWNYEEMSEQLSKVKLAISFSAQRFTGYSQHDAHEFLQQVLDQLKEEVGKLTTEHSSMMMLTSNPIETNLEFTVSQLIECLNCKNPTITKDTFNDLSLDIPISSDNDDHPISLQNMVDKFFLTENIERKCESCTSDASIMRRQVMKMPRILILHIKRYEYDSATKAAKKLAKPIVIPKYLTLSKHQEVNAEPFLDITKSSKNINTVEDTHMKMSNQTLDCSSLSPSSAPITSPITPSKVQDNLNGSDTGASPLLNGSRTSSTKGHSQKEFRHVERGLNYSDAIDNSCTFDKIINVTNAIEHNASEMSIVEYNLRKLREHQKAVQLRLLKLEEQHRLGIPTESLMDSINTTIETPVIVSEYPTIEIGPYEELQLKKAIEMSIAQNELSFQDAMQKATKLSLLEKDEQCLGIPTESLMDSINTTIETPVIVSEYPTIEIGPYEELQLKKAIEMSIAQDEHSFDDAIQEATKLSILEQKDNLSNGYRFCSVVSHLGSSSDTGHYIAHVYNDEKKLWLSFDDCHVKDTTEEDVQNKCQTSGYIFFYVAM